MKLSKDLEVARIAGQHIRRTLAAHLVLSMRMEEVVEALECDRAARSEEQHGLIEQAAICWAGMNTIPMATSKLKGTL